MATITYVPVTEGEALGAPAAEAAPGMPQLNFETFPNQIFWLAVALVAIYLILTRVALPRIGAVLAERQGAITNDIAAAEDLRRKAAEAEEAHDKALADARAEAGRISKKTRDEIQGELDRAIAEADAEIAARTAESEREIAAIRAEAENSIRQVARDTAEELVSALGGQPDGQAVDQAVATRMER